MKIRQVRKLAPKFGCALYRHCFLHWSEDVKGHEHIKACYECRTYCVSKAKIRTIRKKIKFVKPDLMPHHIKITNVKVERLQDISDEDCLREGIDSSNAFEIGYGVDWVYQFPNDNRSYFTPREAFAALIDKVSGKGTWDSNPWVFVYEFKLID